MKQANRERKTPVKETGAFSLNDEQKIAAGYIYDNPITIITGRPGCLAKGTLIFMYDGTFKKVEDVVIGDKLMGPDSKPRIVLELKRGREQMYWIRQKRGIDYKVNESHILSLVRVQPEIYPRITINSKRYFNYNEPPIHPKKESIVNISVKDFLKVKRKRQYRGYISSSLTFKERSLDIDPYYLGLWLGDGNKSCVREITTSDLEIEEYLINLGAVKAPGKYKWLLPTNASINDAVKKYFNVINVSKINEKFVPKDYIFNSKENRLQLLAGILDSDGHYVLKGKYYDITLKDKTLADNITLLSRTLGFKTNIRSKTATMKRDDGSIYSCPVFRISITPTEPIPCKINRKKNTRLSNFKNRRYTGIAIEKDVIDDYYGFTLDGDHLFMLEDLTVTHNSGKSFVAAHCALDFLTKKMTDKVMLLRPTVEVGRSLGYLKGGLEDKIEPYFEAFLDNVFMCGASNKERVQGYIASGVFQESAIQFVRGKTFNEFVVIDESQNTTRKEMEAVITRLGKTGKMVILGDLQQKDITDANDGLSWVIDLANHFEEIRRIDLKGNHRHDLVQRILDYTYNKNKR